MVARESQPLPIESLNEANDEHVTRPRSGPSDSAAAAPGRRLVPALRPLTALGNALTFRW
jgi:hypothetical protein